MSSQTRSLQQEKHFSGIKLTQSCSFTMKVSYDASQFVKPLRDDEQFHTIESTASDEEELCVIAANRTVQTGRIESITP